MKGLEVRGRWTKAREGESKGVIGSLKFTPTTNVLELDGCLGVGGDIEKEIITGITRDGKEVTLLDCMQIGRKTNSYGVVERYNVGTILIGKQYKIGEEINFNKIELRYPNMESWVAENNFNDRPVWKDNKLIGYEIDYVLPPIFKTEIDNCIFEISTKFNINHEEHKREILHKNYISVECNESSSLKEILSLEYKVRHFYSLCIGKGTAPLEIYVYDGDKKLQVYYCMIDYEKNIEEVDSSKIRIKFDDIRKDLDVYLRNWFRKAEELEPVFNLYFTNLYMHRNIEEFMYITYAQAIETFHRKVCGGNYIDELRYLEILYPKFVDAIPQDNSISSEFKESLKGKFKFQNEYSLNKRLKDLFNKYELLKEIVPRPKVFIQRIVDTRNYLTHYNENLKETSYRGIELVYANELLKIIIEICLMKEIELEDSIIMQGEYFRKVKEYAKELGLNQG